MKKLLGFYIFAAGFLFFSGCKSKLPEAIQKDKYWNENPYNTPVINRGKENFAWDFVSADNPFIFCENGVYYCFYEGENLQHVEQIGLAVSKDFVNWEKYEVNPVITAGAEGAWDSKSVKIPVVEKKDDTYYLLYTGFGENSSAIGLATSKDLYNWEKYKSNPVIPGKPDTWEPLVTTCPNIIKIQDTYHIVYRGLKELYKDQNLGLAWSKDFINWERNPKPFEQFPDVLSFSILENPKDKSYWGMTEHTPPRFYYYTNNLREWSKGGEILFSAGWVSTPSQPVSINGKYWTLYEKYDRIYRASLEDFVYSSSKLSQAEIPFYDEFSSSEKSMKFWRQENGKWLFADGRLSQLSLKNEYYKNLANTKQLTGCAASGSIKILDGNGEAGICLSTYFGDYQFSLSPDAKKRVRLKKTAQGKSDVVEWVEENSFEIFQQIPYSIEIETQDNVIRCYINGALVLKKISEFIIPEGRYGFFTQSASAEFDDINIQKPEKK